MAAKWCWIALTVALLGLVASAGAGPSSTEKKDTAGKDSRNLVPNGDFEEGDETPAHWQTVDGLTTFYVKDPDPKRGKCIKFDTDVLQSQGYEWWAHFARAEMMAAELREHGLTSFAGLLRVPSPK